MRTGEPARSGPQLVPRFLTVAAAFIVLCAAVHSAPAQSTADWNLATLMAAMRQVRSSAGRFVEMRYLHLLNQPQRSSGRLLYVAPNYLQKTTTEPTPSRLTITGDRLTIEQQGQPTRAIALQDYSEIGTLADSTRAVLAGDLAALTRSFTTAIAGSPDGWTLTLEPRDAKLRQIVTSIRIQGVRDTIRDVLTLQADGDRTDMTVTPEPQ
jgi:hypothetical protein